LGNSEREIWIVECGSTAGNFEQEVEGRAASSGSWALLKVLLGRERQSTSLSKER
jgi:hypothetical protein